MTSILGINTYHGDATAALVIDGHLVAAVEEERFNRIKHWAGFPEESIRWCLDFAGLKASNLDHVAISFDPKANFARRVGYVLRERPSLGGVLRRLRRQGKTLGIEDQFALATGTEHARLKAKFHRVEHHEPPPTPGLRREGSRGDEKGNP